MRYRPFGRSGLALSTIGLHLPLQALAKSRGLMEKLITAGLESGINTYHFDGADPKTLSAAADIFSVVERRLLFISVSASDTAHDGMTYEFTALKDRLRGAIKDSGLLWLDLVLFDKAGTTVIPQKSYDFVKTLQRSNAAIGNEMAVFAEDTFPERYSKASDLIPQAAKRGWFGAKAANPLAGAGTYAFLHQTPDWSPEELCLGYALSQPSMSCIYVTADSAHHLEALARVPERHLPSSVPAQIEMARFTAHAPKVASR
jgi:hypothetical protein